MKALLCTLALLSLAACTQVNAPAPVADTHDADVKAINDLEASALKAWAAKDMDGILAQYAPDSILVVTATPPSKGTAELRGMLTELLKDPALTLNLEAAVTEVSGSIGYQRGTYTIQVTDPKSKKPVTEKGTYLNVLKKQADGRWLVTEDINSAGPPPAK